MSETFHPHDGAYFIASPKHTRRESHHITFWAPNYCGYRLVLPGMGRYSWRDACQHNDGRDCIAVPDSVDFRLLFEPQPIDRYGRRWYDGIGPVMRNTRENWEALLKLSSSPAGALPMWTDKPRPEWFGRRKHPSEVVRVCTGGDCYEVFPGNVSTCPQCGTFYRRRVYR